MTENPPVRKLAGRAIARLRLEVVAEHGTVCYLCRGEVDLTEPYDRGRNPRYATVEHVIPQSKGGSHDVDNLRLAHKGCNSARGNRTPTDPGPHTRQWIA